MRRHFSASKALTIVAVLWLAGVLVCCPVFGQITYHPAEGEGAEAGEPGSWGTIGVGGQSQDVDGNWQRFEQYYTPTRGGYPSRLHLDGVGRGGTFVSAFDARDITEPGRSLHLRGLSTTSLVGVDVDYRRDEFYEEFGSGASFMERDDLEAGVTIPVCSDLDLDFTTGYVSLAGPSNLYDVDWRSFRFGGRAYWSGDTVTVDAGYNLENFRQMPGVEISGTDRTVSASVSPSGNHRHMLGAEAFLQNTQLEGLGRDVERDGAAVTLSSTFGSDLKFAARLSTEETDQTITRNAYAVSRDSARASLLYTGLDKVRLEGGADFTEVEYIERFQSFVDEPETQTFWARGRYAPCRDLKLSGSFLNREVDEVPLRSLGTTGGQDQGPGVTFDEYERISGTASYSICRRAGVSGSWRQDQWGLSPGPTSSATTETELQSTSITAWYMPWEKLTVTGSFLNQDWEVSGVDGVGLTGGDFASKLNAYTVGMALQINSEAWMEGAFTHAYSFGAVGTKDNSVNASWHRELCQDMDVAVTFAWEDFNEAIVGNPNDFEATLIGGSISHSF